MIALVPVKPFGVAKRRLSDRFTPPQRRKLGMAIAAHTLSITADAGLEPRVVTGSDEVAAWADHLGVGVVEEPPGGGLDGAARAGVHSAAGSPWMVIHADLPALDVADLTALTDAGPGAIAPSHDGGTSAVTGISDDIEFSYGPGSFHRHLAAHPTLAVVCRPGLAYDLDDTADYDVIVTLGSGRWMGEIT
ncbi:MAG: 2-phospho-L-lactate guanylyltransferase [Acidimicrobiia bacterium]|nr:2-phospho-L-lactate guanylyltransferase [Acidimicrobiia bacterium]